jgi:hypothetical protein
MQRKKPWTILIALSIVLSPLVAMAAPYTVTDIVGTWENNGLASGSDAPWWIRGPITLNADGSWSAVFEEYPSKTSTVTGTFTISPDGTVSIPWTNAAGGRMVCNMDSGKTIMVCTHSWPASAPSTASMAIMTKKGLTYSQADLVGTWGVNITASGPGTPWWEYGTLTAAGNGAFSGTMQEYGTDPDSVSGVLTISGDGVLTWPDHSNDAHARWTMDSGKTIMVGTSTWVTGSPGTSEMSILTKKAFSYSQADVSGTWAYHSLVSGGPYAPGWYRGLVTVDANGFATFIVTDNTGSQEAFTKSMIISPDGSFSSLAPAGGGCSMGASKTVIACTITETKGNGTVEMPIFVKTSPSSVLPSLTLIKSGAGSGTVTSSLPGIDCGSTCSVSYASSTVVTLTATADAGSYFAGWSTPCAGNDTCTVTVTGSTEITAAFYPLSYLDTVQKLYIGYYQRSADPGGLVFWVNGLSTIDTNHDGNFVGDNIIPVLSQFAYSDEARNLYGGDITSSNIATVIDSIYQGLFGRDPEADGKAFWVNSFNTGASTPATILWELMKGAQGTDAQTVQNRLVAASRFTQIIDPNLDGLPPFQVTYGANDIPAVRTWLAGVTWNPATIPSHDETTAFIKSNIADPGDPILNP